MTTTARDHGATPPLAAGRADITERTLRKDRWWLPPLVNALGLATFVVYATIRSFWGSAYYYEPGHYLSPFYSPCLSATCVEGARHFGTVLPEFPPWIPLAILALPFLLGFRVTCYYYRKSYYRAFWASPPACAVSEPHSGYSGETRFPLILQNAHRYFFYLAFLISVLNTYDLIVTFEHGLGLGNIIMTINVVGLWLYTLSCHSCRHGIGGRLKHFSRHPVRYKMWTWVTALNTRHMQLAWTTIGTLILTDLYIMLISSGVFPDPRIVN